MHAPFGGQPESPDRQERRRQEEQVLRLLQPLARQPGPKEKEPAEAQRQKRLRILTDPFSGQASLLGVERRFAHVLVLRIENAIVAGVVGHNPPSIGLRIVAAAELHAEVAADEDQLAELRVIAHQPGRQYCPKDHRAKYHRH